MLSPHPSDWQSHESLLQSYRSQFLLSQSLLLVAGAVLAGRLHGALVAIGAIALVMIWGIWFPVIRARQLLVDYHKFSGRLSAEARAGLCGPGEYVKNRQQRRQADQVLGIRSHWRETRVKLDLLLPLLLSAMWLVLIGASG